MTRGGKRPGAGGPKLADESSRSLTFSITVPAAVMAALESYMVRHRLRSRGAAVEALLAARSGMTTGKANK